MCQSGEPKLSIVVGTFNRVADLARTIDSILKETTTPLHVYVTDAGSTDGTIDYLNALVDSRVTAIFKGEKLGQAKAYNLVFETIQTPYTCWLSDDTIIVNGGLDLAIECLENNPSIGMVALKVKDMQGPFADAPYIGGISSVGVLNVNQGVLRTHVLHFVNGFCERFRDYGIDPDLTTKVLFSGYQVAYTKQISIHHYRNWGDTPNASASPQMMERQLKYKKMYSEKYGTAPLAVWWRLRMACWAILHRTCRTDLNSAEKDRYGLVPRDWHNVFCGRFISLLDPLWTHKKSFHLVQRYRVRALLENTTRE